MPGPPVEPPETPWVMPDPAGADPSGLVAVGADLEPGTLLAAYRHGLFPMPKRFGRTVGWWSPDPRGVIPLDGLRVGRSLRKACGRFEVRVDTAFEDVIDGCADPRRPYGWIDRQIRDAYRTLHRLGWVHSVEAWTPDGRLAGGLYGVAIGGLFAGESMFHRETDASKVALVALVEMLRDGSAAAAGTALLDVQWTTDHLQTLGAVDVPREEYLRRLAVAVREPLPPAFALR